MNKLSLLFAYLVLFSGNTFAQKILLLEGDFTFLRNFKSLKVEYSFKDMAVGKFATEKEYIDSKVTEHNKKEARTGDKWEQGWEGAKSNLYPAHFEELLNKYIQGKGMSASAVNADAKYTLIVHTTFIEPGLNIGTMKNPASINVEYLFVETTNKNRIVAKLSAINILGRDATGYDFDAGVRISEGYAKAGKLLGQYLEKKVL